MKCSICSGKLGGFPETLVFCGHKGGAVHLGCCISDCSWNKQPCEHSIGIYERL